MKGSQFAHMKTFGRKSGKRQGGEKVFTAGDIIAEIKRDDGACPHVDYPDKKPKILAGTCSTFYELEEAHEQACSVKVEVDYTNPKTRKKVKRTKSIRQDTHTLFVSVDSLPILSVDALADEAVMDECLIALKLFVDFEQARITAAGGEFAMAVIHLDEKYVHVHVIGLDRKRGSVNHLHPGKKARDEVRRSSKKDEAYGKEAMHDYCEALRDWQDDVHSQVSSVVGLCRYGPKRARLTRAEWKEVQIAQQEMRKLSDVSRLYKELVEVKDKLFAVQETLQQEAGQLQSEKKAFEDEKFEMVAVQSGLNDQRKELDEREARLNKREQQVERKEVVADVKLVTADALMSGTLAFHDGRKGSEFTVSTGANKEEAASLLKRIKRAPEVALAAAKNISAKLHKLHEREQHLNIRSSEFERKKAEFDEAVETGCDAVDNDEIRYCPPDESHDEDGLVYGPNAPKDSSKKNSLTASIQPAFKAIKKYAKRIWHSEPARLEREIRADPSMVDVKVAYNREKAIQSDDILTMDVKVSFDRLQGLSKPMRRIVGGIANVIATKVGKATMKLAREQMQDEFETLKSYRDQCQKIFGAQPIAEQRSLLSTERKFENMTSTAPDPRDAEKREREAKRNRGEER